MRPEMAIHVCMMSYSFYENDGRVMRYAEALVNSGASVDVIALRREGLPETEFINGVRVLRVQRRSKDEKGKATYLFRMIRFFIRSALEVMRQHYLRAYDLIHVHSVPDFEVFATLIPRLLGAKVILDIHDMVPEFYAAKFGIKESSPVIWCLKVIERASARYADHVIAANDLWAQKLISRSVPSDRCTTFINYPDLSIFNRGLRVRELDGTFRVIYPGSLNWHQGIDIAIRACAKVLPYAPRLRFDVYGEGPMAVTLGDMVRQQGVSDTIRLHPPLPIREIAAVMANADLGVVPKRNDSFGGDAFSTKILEFMALGVPVVAARTRIDQHYFDESLLRFFRAGDEDDLARVIREAVDDPQGNSRRVNNALKFVEDNCWDRRKFDYLKLVRALVGTRD